MADPVPDAEQLHPEALCESEEMGVETCKIRADTRVVQEENEELEQEAHPDAMAEVAPGSKQLHPEVLCKIAEMEADTCKIRTGTRKVQEEKQDLEERSHKMNCQTRKTNLPEFLDACHSHLHAGLKVQTEVLPSTRGNPANAKTNLRPERLRLWTNFSEHQGAIWEKITESKFAQERYFASLHTLRENGENTKWKTVSSELDLYHFQRLTIEEPVSHIVEQMSNDQALKESFGLRDSVKFEYPANTLCPEQEVKERVHAMSLSQLCMYNADVASRGVVLVIESKAPHKLPLGHIYEGLDDMYLEDVIECDKSSSLRDHFRQLIAAIVTQAFSSMVQAGVEYGCVCTGEAYIFLHVPDDPTTVYYFLSVPKGDVGETNEWTPDADSANRLHLTALGQMLAFTLQALSTPPHSQKWQEQATTGLKTWEFAYEVLLDGLPSHEAPSSEYRPPQDTGFLRISPDFSRSHRQKSASEEKLGPDIPSQQPADSDSQPDAESRYTEQIEQYCTHRCLLGLVEEGPLDLSCPNAKAHGRSRHKISLSTFLKRIRRQLSNDLDHNCGPIGRHGNCGVPFRVKLEPYGYTVFAKACPLWYVHHLKWEAKVYNHLRSIQGTHVPVYLGNIDMDVPYYYKGICELRHMMFLSYGGTSMDMLSTSVPKELLKEQRLISETAVSKLGVLNIGHGSRNRLWNEKTQRVMVIDFERAEIKAKNKDPTPAEHVPRQYGDCLDMD